MSSSSRNQPSAGHEASAPSAAHTPGPWEVGDGGPNGAKGYIYCDNSLGSAVAIVYGEPLRWTVFSRAEEEANARLIAAAPEQNAALNYVADMTYCGADGEWHFKPGYDPQVVLDAIAAATGNTASQSGPLAEGDKSREDQ